MARSKSRAVKRNESNQLYNLLLGVYIALFVIYFFELGQIQSAFALNMINFATAVLITHIAQAVLVILPMVMIAVVLLLSLFENS